MFTGTHVVLTESLDRLQHREGLLLNVSFSKDVSVKRALMQT
ncbi:MAG TPA: hypothetical protein VGI93_11135 [Steroidobacteraceae bacterium]